MNHTCVLRTVAGVMLSSLLLFAQDSPSNLPSVADLVARQIQRLTAELSLTSTQQTQATAIFTDEQTAAASVRTALRTAHTALTAAIISGDTGAITTQAIAIGGLTTTEIESRSKAEAALYAILTADQQAKFKQRISRGPGGPGGGGPGGGGPGGGGPGGPPPAGN